MDTKSRADLIRELADHIEMEHERELPPSNISFAATLRVLTTIHDRMHRDRDDWRHTH